MNRLELTPRHHLTQTQLGMLLRGLSEPRAGLYVQQLVWSLPEELEIAFFRAAWQRVIARHAALRSSLRWEGVDEPVQEFAVHAEVPVEVEDLQPLPAAEREAAIDRILIRERVAGSDLSRAPGFRIQILRVSREDYRVVQTFHHALLDGYSHTVVAREVLTIYDALRRGEEADLGSVPSFGEFLAWMRQRASPAGEEAFWRRELAGVVAPPRPHELRLESAERAGGLGGADRELRLSPDLSAALNDAASRTGVSLSTVIYAAWAVALSRLGSGTDVVFGITNSGRRNLPGDLGRVVGMTITTSPFRLRVDPGVVVSDWLREIRSHQLRLRAHEDTPLGEIMKWSGMPAGTPLFHTSVVFNFDMLGAGAENGDGRTRSFRLHEHTEFPLLLQVFAEPRMLLRLEYHRSALEADSADRILLQLEAILRSIAEDPSRRTADLVGLESGPSRVRRATGPFPLSTGQERIWTLHRVQPDHAVDNLSLVLRMRGRLNGRALMRTLGEVIRRHEALRTVFPVVSGAPVQEVRPPTPISLPVVDLEFYADQDREAEARRLAREEVLRPYHLEAGPLFRATLLRLAPDDHLLALGMHQIVSDNRSCDLLHREIAALYDSFSRDEPSPFPEIPFQFGDIVVGDRESRQAAMQASLEYWKAQLAGAPALDLSTDHPRPATQGFRAESHHFWLPAELTRLLRAFARETGTTLHSVLLAGFQTVLHRYSGQDDLVIGSTVSGRRGVVHEALVGRFENVAAIRTSLSDDPGFRELVGRVHSVTRDALAHSDVPLELVMDALEVRSEPTRAPLIQVLFALRPAPGEPVELNGMEISRVELEHGTARFDLTLTVTEDEDRLGVSLEYDSDLYRPETMERMASHLQILLEGAVIEPDRAVSKLPLLTPAERDRMLVQWNDTTAPYPRERCIHQLIEAQAARTPDARALIHRDRSLTYREMDERANQIARRLRTLGVGPDRLVGVYMDRSVEMVVGLLGVHKAGGAYVPLDPAYPTERIALMLEDSGIEVLITQSHLIPRLPPHQAPTLVLEPSFEAVAGESRTPIGSEVAPHHLAYVIYTSGSTGRPKGVMVEHRNVVNFFVGMDERLGTEPGTWLAVTSISFDISVLELFWTLARGFTVVVQGEEVEARISVPSIPRRDKRIGFSLFYFAANESDAGREKYRILLEGARFADRNGFEAVWTPERHFHSFGGLYPNPSVTSAALATVTERVHLRAGSVVLPLHSTIRVAEEWSVVDNLSDGRVGIAVASGWHDRDFVFAPDNYANRRELIYDQIDTLRRLWRGESIRAKGGSGKDIEVSIFPRPVQQELPIWVTAGGTPATFEAAGTRGCFLLTHLLGQNLEQLESKLAAYRTAWRAAGHPGDGHVTLMMHTFIGTDMEAVRAIVYRPFCEYLRTSVDLISQLAAEQGQDIRATSFTDEDMAALLDHAFERYFQTSALLGTAESCAPMVDRLRAIGVDEIACLVDFGIDGEEVLDNLEHLADLHQRVNPTGEDEEDADYSLAAQIVRHRVTHLQCTPSMGTMLLAQPEVRQALGSLRTILFGGEALPGALAAELRAATPAQIINMYGPTETTIWSSTYPANGDPGPVPIGSPIANTSFYVVDRNLEPVPTGIPGELLIGGDGVVRGYLHRPELTQERFVPNRFGEGRLYRTGDLVRWRSDGVVEFLGRTDFQVKIRGHRIELGEIETLLQEHPAVREAVLLAREDVPGDRRLVAYLVPRVGVRLDLGELRARLRARLPEYMIPAHLLVLDDLPRTPNAKVDRKQLPAPDQAAVCASAAASPSVPAAPTETETLPAADDAVASRIAEVWRDVLRVPQVGYHDNFFDLGGNSLLTIRVQLRLREILNREVPLTTLFRFPTIQALARHLEHQVAESAAAAEGDKGSAAEAKAGTDRAALRLQARNRRPSQRS